MDDSGQHKKLSAAFRNAVIGERWRQARRLLQDGQVDDSYLALQRAASGGQDDLVRAIIDAGADVAANDNMAVKIAARRRHGNVLNALIKGGADIRFDDDRLLFDAVKDGHREIADILMKNGADVQKHGAALLNLAAEEGHHRIIERLLANGVDIETLGGDALKKAVEAEQTKVAEVLCQYGKFDTQTLNDHARAAYEDSKILMVNTLIGNGADPGIDDAGGHELLRIGVLGYYPYLVETLLDKGVDPFAFHCAAFHSAETVENDWQRRNITAQLEKWMNGDGRMRAEKRFRETYGETYTAEDLATGGLHLAAKAGLMDEVVERCYAPGGAKPSAAALSRDDGTGTTVIEILAERGDLATVFKAELWRGRSAEMREAWASVPEARRGGVDFESVLQDTSLNSIRSRANRLPRLK